MNKSSTFRERVKEFWTWFPTVADSVAESVESGDASEQLAEFMEAVRERVGGLSWVFGPGEAEGRLSFTVTGEGQKARQLLSHYWLSLGVDVPGWDFFCSRQPTPPDQLAELAVEVAGSDVDVETLMVATEVDEENEVVNIKAWHEAFENIEQEGRFQILFLLLDEALGEYGTQTKLGSIEFKHHPDAKPLAALPGYLSSLWLEQGWEDLSPLETYSGYQSEPSEDFPRADTIAGYTLLPELVLGFLNSNGCLEEDPVEGTGAQYLYIQLDGEGADSREDPLEFRTSIEEEIAKRLTGGGFVVGGATGRDNSYIDLVIFDGSRSLAAIDEAMAEMQINGKYEIKPFVQ